MTYKQIETSREIRLWIGQVIVPVATGAAIAMANPEIRRTVVTKFNNVKKSVKQKFKMEKSQGFSFVLPYAGYEKSMYSDKVIATDTFSIMKGVIQNENR